MQAQAAARRQTSFGSHTPVLDEHGEDLDYIDNLEHEEQNAETWWCLIADAPINKQLEQAASARELQEAALLEGLTQAATPTEEEVLLAADSRRPGLSQMIHRLQGLPDSTLSELSQHIDEIRRRRPLRHPRVSRPDLHQASLTPHHRPLRWHGQSWRPPPTLVSYPQARDPSPRCKTMRKLKGPRISSRPR